MAERSEAGEAYVPQKVTQPTTSARPAEYFVGYTPGKPEMRLSPGQAKLIRAGSDLIFQIHYTANGKETKDKTSMGIIFAKQRPAERVMTFPITNRTFELPPGASDHPVKSELTFKGDARARHILAAYACPRKELPLRFRHSRGNANNCPERAEIRFQLAASICSVGTLASNRGQQAGMLRDLRQLAEQPGKSRSEGDCALGRSKLGRDDGRVYRSRFRRAKISVRCIPSASCSDSDYGFSRREIGLGVCGGRIVASVSGTRKRDRKRLRKFWKISSDRIICYEIERTPDAAQPSIARFSVRVSYILLEI